MKLIVTLLIQIVFSQLAFAENLGSYGQTYQLDRDARDQLKDTIRRKQENGEMDAYWKNYRAKVENSIKNPQSLGIKTQYTAHTELRELKFTIGQDYVNERGQVIVKRGTLIEPLKIQPLRTGLIFIDGTDQKQIDYAIKRGLKQPFKIVLTAGSPYYLRFKYQNSQWFSGKGIPFYFDQRKMIITNFQRLYGISLDSVPVTLFQNGEKLQLDYGMLQ